MSVHHKPIRADLINSQTCRVRAAGLIACSSSPALSLCRLLIKAALRIRTIREGASLEVNSTGDDFIPFRGLRRGSLVRKSDRPLGVGTSDPRNRIEAGAP